MYIENLLKVIQYLEGKLEIYDGKHDLVINTWQDAWDEMMFLGYDPQNASSIKRYIKQELQ